MGRGRKPVAAVTMIAPLTTRAHARTGVGGVDGVGGVAEATHRLSLSATARMIARCQRSMKDVNLAGVYGEARDRLRYRSLGHLSDSEMKSIVRFARACAAQLAEAENSDGVSPQVIAHLRHMSEAARELFVSSSYGMVSHWLRTDKARYLKRFADEEPEHKREIAYQIAREALIDIIDRLADPEQEAHILTYANMVVATRLRDAVFAEQNGPTLPRSRQGRDMMKMQYAVGALRRQRGHETAITAGEVQEMTGAQYELVVEMLPQVLAGPPVFLDDTGNFTDIEDHVRYRTREGLMDLLGAAHASASAEDEFFEDEVQERVRGVIAKLSPFDRALATAQFGLAGEPVEQKHMYSGVYEDASGHVFSAETTTRRAWNENNPDNVAQSMSQVELNHLLEDKKVRWQSLTAEAQELGQLLAAEKGASEVERMVGIPLTSGIIQGRLEALALRLAADENLLVDRPRYRGGFELQNSGAACALMRRALAAVGAVDATEVGALKAGRAKMKEGAAGDSPLTDAGIRQGWVDASTGKVNWPRLQEDVRTRRRDLARTRSGFESTDELAELMTAA